MNGDNSHNGLIVFALVLAAIALAMAAAAQAVAAAAMAIVAAMASVLLIVGVLVVVVFIARRVAQARPAARDQQVREAALQLALLLGRPGLDPRSSQVAEQLAQLLNQPLDPHTREVAERLAVLLGHSVSRGFASRGFGGVGWVVGEPPPRRWVRDQPAGTDRQAR